MSLFRKLIAPIVLALGLGATSASAAILVTVDITDPTAVTFTGNDVQPIASDSTSVFRGFTLLDFLTGASTQAFFTDNQSNFRARGSQVALRDIFFPTSGGGDDLNIYNSPSFGANINLRTDRRAFANTLVADLSSIASLLPGVGTFGQIILGDNPTANQRRNPVVGAYEVVGVAPVPLPAPGLLLIGAIGAVAATRKRKQAKAAVAA